MNAPLKPDLPWIEGESISGFVSRSAKPYKTTPRDYCTDLGMRWPSLCSGHDEQLERLAWLTGEDLEFLRVWNTKKVGAVSYKIGKTAARKGVLRRIAVRLCPKCVASAYEKTGLFGIFQMVEWSVECLHSCSHHNCRLITVPSAGHAHSIYDFAARVMEHKEVVFQSAEQPSNMPSTAFENYVRQRIWYGPQDDWLRGFDLMHLYRGCSTLGAAMNGVKTMGLEKLSAHELQALCQLGFERLESGPAAYRAVLQSLHGRSSVERPFFSVDMGQLYKWLRSAHTDPALKKIANITRKHVFETYPVPLNKKVFGESPGIQNLLTIDEARKQSRFGAVFLKKLLGHMNGVSEAEALTRTDVHVDEIEQAQKYWDSLINLTDAGSQMGIFPKQVRSLQNRGVLPVVQITSSLRYLPRSEVSAILADIDALPKELPDKSVIPIMQYCRTKGIPIARLIELWRNGELDGKICRGEGKGFQALEVDWNVLCDKNELKLDRDLHLIEAASYLKIGLKSIRQLRDRGYLTEVKHRNPDSNRLKRYISQASIEKFEHDYITLGQLALQRKVESMHLAQELDREGIVPITSDFEQLRVYDRLLV